MNSDQGTTGLMERAAGPLTDEELDAIHAWWRAANYLSVGQIYLMGNPLLREPLKAEHVKPRLLGHWGTTPGLNFIYAHLNRAIAAREDREPLAVRGELAVDVIGHAGDLRGAAEPGGDVAGGPCGSPRRGAQSTR